MELLKQKAEEILSRKITKKEGLEILKIENKEKELKISFPKELKNFYLILGENKLFTEGFQRFADIDEIFINDNKLVFLQENQSVIYWSIDLNDNQTIYQTTNQDFNEKVKWYKENFKLSEFIEMLLFIQCVMADYEYHKISESNFEYFGSLNIQTNQEFNVLSKELDINFHEMIKTQNVLIYQNKDTIILIFLDNQHQPDLIFTCSRNEEYFNLLIEKYNFSEL